jgi:hypothetical protein
MTFITVGVENSAVGSANGENIRQIKKHLLESLSNCKIIKINYKIVKYNDPLDLEYDYLFDVVQSSEY